MRGAKGPLRVGRTLANISLRRVRLSVVVLVAAGMTNASSFEVAHIDDPLDFEDRVRYQRRIEEVYWQHRIWPAENPGSKPALDEVLPDAVLRERVASYLEKSTALEIFWSRPLTGEQLQAEVDRMVRGTKNPSLLRELFSALDNDPFLVAECLARPVLVDRLLRDWYARDARFHGSLKEQAEAALAAHAIDTTRMQDLGGEYVETEWRLAAEDSEDADLGTELAEHAVIDSSAERWSERFGQLANAFGIERDPEEAIDPAALLERIPTGRLSPPAEENDRFVAVSVLSKAPDRVKIATVSWLKRPVDAWWVEEGRAGVESAGRINPVPLPSGGYELPVPSGGGCAADTWTELWYVPTGREYHTAVWTGTEMIIWGGRDRFGRLNTGGRYDPATESWTKTSTGPGVPTPRYVHTAVWTGTEMIVWGGVGEEAYENTGGRYAPQTDDWTVASAGAEVPTERGWHTAVWTGTEMIVWGGRNSGEWFNTGARYAPLTDSWSATSTANRLPGAREQHTAVWTGKEMIVWGGFHDGAHLNSGGRYDPVSDRWRATPTAALAPAARSRHSAVWTGTEMIVWGGADNAGVLNTGGRYDPTIDRWGKTSTGQGVPQERTRHTAVWTGTEMIVWGGGGNDVHNPGGRYDPATDSWLAESVIGAPPRRSGHTAVWTGTEMIVWGGRGSLEYQDTGGRYDPATDLWTATSLGPVGLEPTENHSALWTGTEMIVWGGFTGPYTLDGLTLNTGGRYDPGTDAWTATPTGTGVPTDRAAHVAVWTGAEMIVWGGYSRNDNHTTYPETGGRYDPMTDSWVETSTGSGVPTGRSHHTAVWTGSEMIVWGGFPGADTGSRYDPSTDDWTATSTASGVPTGRYAHTAVWTGGEMIVWGGRDSDTAWDTGGRYDPTTDSWSATSAASGVPTGRFQHTAVWTGSKMFVWGGRGGGYQNTGGWYEPATDGWAATSTGADVPQERAEHTAVWTGTEMIVWGGDIDVGFSTDTGGRYDPVTDGWSATSTGAGTPTRRDEHTAVWTGTQMIVWAGRENSVGQLSGGGSYCP
jgi:hypothetical protein